MSQEKSQSWHFMICTSYTHTSQFTVPQCSLVVLLILFVVSVPSVLQVVVCFTCVILQAKSEENTEGVFSHNNYRNEVSLQAEIHVISHSSPRLVNQSEILSVQ